MQILYRGKRVDNGEWVFGDLLNLNDGGSLIVNNIRSACINDKGNFINTRAPLVCEVYSDTVGQYTGVCDKDGNKIFAGDILGGNKYTSLFVRDRPGGFLMVSVYRVHRVNNIGSVPLITLEKSGALSYLGIKGNIHDNPELLEV